MVILLKNINSQTITQKSSNILTKSKRSIKIESDRGSEWYSSVFQNFLKSKIIQHYSRFTDEGRSIEERVIRTRSNLLKKPVFLRGKADWISELPSVVKKYYNTIHHSTEKTPIQASKKSNQKLVYNNLKDNRKFRKPKFKLGDLVRTSDIRKVFSKGDSTNYSYKLYTITEFIHDTLPSHRINYLPERYDENILLPTKLSLGENNKILKKLNLIQ